MTDRFDTFAKLCDKPWFCFAVVCLASFLTVSLPILTLGLHASGDLGVYLGFAQSIRDAFESGNLFPGWANDNLGFGSVGIRFYPPVSYYLSAIISLLTNDWYASICLYFFFWMVVGCWGTFLFVRDYGSGFQALSASLLYAIIPFHLAEVYQFSLYAEYAASSILPFCFLFVSRLCRYTRWKDAVALAIVTSLLVLTHIPTTMIGLISLAGFGVLMIDRMRFWKTVGMFLAVWGGVLSATCFYWVRLLNELEWLAHYDPKYATGFSAFDRWFFPHTILGADLPEFYQSTFRNLDAMVILTAALFVPALLGTIRRRFGAGEVARALKAITFTGLFGLFMLSYASYPVWSVLPFIHRIQFPWRWMTGVSVLAVLSLSLALPAFISSSRRSRQATMVLLISLIVMILAYDVRQSFAKGNLVSRAEFANILEARNDQAGNNFAAWWPVWASDKALGSRDAVSVEGRKVTVAVWDPELREFSVDAGPERAARIATFYYPHWRVEINGAPGQISMDEDGALVIDIPPMRSNVRLFFDEPLIYCLSGIASAAIWVVMLVVFCAFRFRPTV